MAKSGPSRLRPLTLRFLTAPARAHLLERSNVWMVVKIKDCLLYTSDAADDTPCVDLGGRRIIKKKKKTN
ncbi:proline iminopeptidase [Lactobacillus rhamnosus GG] [Lacticaseibacillus rhamnosus]|nr:proline iminopeptidase [Lactobacillus rhamnosus GG] [Lacticaseibacillus rhamnosus]